MSDKLDILFLINPISGVGKKNIIPKCIDKFLDKSKFKHTIKYTEYRKHGFEIASQLKNTFDVIVAIGGDGTVNEIGTALINTNTCLGIIPTGSGNGLARHLNIPLKIKQALLTINSYNSVTIDTATVNNIPFLGTCGFGFDAHIATEFEAHHKRGFLSYAKLIKQEFFSYKPLEFKVTYANSIIERKAFMYSVANSSQFGNGFTISPKSDLQDGIFEHVFLDKFKLKDMPLLGKQIFTKQINYSKFHSGFETSLDVNIEILNQDKSIFHIDGEAMSGGSKFQIKVVPKSLTIIC
jgi:YegS/Rv2252/BmrU family lipid kinase